MEVAMFFRSSSTAFKDRKYTINPAGRLLLCVLLACVLFVGAQLAIAGLVAGVSPPPDASTIGLPP